MSKRAKLLVAVLSLTGLLAGSFAGVALAHGPGDADYEVADYCEQGWGGYHGHGAICSETVSELLGLTHEEIHTQRQEGKSLVEIAAAQGVSEDALVDAILAAKTEAVQERVEAGILTQEQADLMLEQMEQRTRQAVSWTDFGFAEDGAFCDHGQAGYGMGMMGMGHGGMMGHSDWQDGRESWRGEVGPGAGPGGMQRWGMGFR